MLKLIIVVTAVLLKRIFKKKPWLSPEACSSKVRGNLKRSEWSHGPRSIRMPGSPKS
jgi:hypothetical protein